ncbi:DUF4882 domain-containing protein [Acinetobacter haemolyticus]|uniref:DUF4882 domain-containing protein n=1 Tax=Acinetobacter haemolyticus TaxID=29430 RepID=UPI003D1CDA88
MNKIGILTLSLALLGCGENQNSSQSSNTTSQSTATTSTSLSLRSLNQSQTCQYNFDATQQDYDNWNNQNSGYMPITIFPIIDGQKFSFSVLPFTEEEFSYISYISTTKAQLSGTNNDGDFTLPKSGIIALEMQLKVPKKLSENSSYISDISLRAITGNGYTVDSNFGFQSGTYDPDFGENPSNLNYSLSSRLSDGTGPTSTYFQYINMTNNPISYQRLGIYINQESKQVGFILNGIDKGYQSNLPAILENISFNVRSGVAIEFDPENEQKFSSELITDRNALQFTYPQGTTDICGNII